MFVDASAICAILLTESDAAHLSRCLEVDQPKFTSPLAIWESTVAIARELDLRPSDAAKLVADFLMEGDIETIPLPSGIAALAVEAFERFGKGRHTAGLNFGDCFAYSIGPKIELDFRKA